MWEEYLVPALLGFIGILVTVMVFLAGLLFSVYRNINDRIETLKEDIAYLKGMIEGLHIGGGSGASEFGGEKKV